MQYGDPSSSIVLIQPVGTGEVNDAEAETAEIRRRTGMKFCLTAAVVDSWNRDLSPWRAPAVFGNEAFGEGAENTLEYLLELCTDPEKTYYIGGYSLAGLFSLWAAYQTDRFQGVAAASPSVWFPGFLPYMKEHRIYSPLVYLSLGEREEKTKNPMLACVGDCMREGHHWLENQGIRCTLEWNPGSHFKDAALRTAKAFAWVMQQKIPGRICPGTEKTDRQRPLRLRNHPVGTGL